MSVQGERSKHVALSYLSITAIGHTWMIEIISLIINKGDRDNDMMKEDIFRRAKFMEQKLPDAPAAIDILAKTAPPRLIKTHQHACIFEEGLTAGRAKFIVVMRNPKDCLLSYYHFYCAIKVAGPFPGTWDDFFELFKAKGLLFGDWLEYNLGWWQERHRDNVLIIKYEDLKRNPRSCILRCASFCGQNLSEEIVQKITEATSFEVMKENPLANMSGIPKVLYDYSKQPFMRKGIVGDWKTVFKQEQSDYIDEYYTTPAAREGLNFHFEL